MITTYFLKSISEDIFKHQETSVIPFEYYMGLSSTAPSLDGTNATEPSDPAYARVKIINSEEIFADADSSGVVSNHTAIYFPESTQPWSGITHYTIYDGETGGNLLIYGELNQEMNIPIKTIIGVPIGELKIKALNE